MYKKGYLTHRAKNLGLKPKNYMQNLEKRGVLHVPNYTEMEIFMLSNFHYKACAKFIPHKSINSLKIKQWRLLKSHLN